MYVALSIMVYIALSFLTIELANMFTSLWVTKKNENTTNGYILVYVCLSKNLLEHIGSRHLPCFNFIIHIMTIRYYNLTRLFEWYIIVET